MERKEKHQTVAGVHVEFIALRALFLSCLEAQVFQAESSQFHTQSFVL